MTNQAANVSAKCLKKHLAEIARLKKWIRHTGNSENICTWGVLKEICSDCRCHRMKDK